MIFFTMGPVYNKYENNKTNRIIKIKNILLHWSMSEVID